MIRIEEHQKEIQRINEEIKQTASPYRKRDLQRRLKKLNFEYSECLKWLGKERKK